MTRPSRPITLQRNPRWGGAVTGGVVSIIQASLSWKEPSFRCCVGKRKALDPYQPWPALPTHGGQ